MTKHIEILDIRPVGEVEVAGIKFPQYNPDDFPEEHRMFIPSGDAEVVSSGQYETIIRKCAAAWRLAMMPFLWGPAGTGKSYVPTVLAGLMQIPLFRVQFTEASESGALLGRVRLVDGESPFILAPFTMLANAPGMAILDEFNAAPPDPQQAIRSVGDSRKVWIADDNLSIDVSDEFRIVLTGNPDWDGLNFGLAPLSDADRRRTIGVWCGYPDKDTEKAIVENGMAKKGLDPNDHKDEIANSVNLMGALRDTQFPFSAGVGDSITMACLLSVGLDPVEAFEATFHGKDPEDMSLAAAALAHVFPAK